MLRGRACGAGTWISEGLAHCSCSQGSCATGSGRAESWNLIQLLLLRYWPTKATYNKKKKVLPLSFKLLLLARWPIYQSLVCVCTYIYIKYIYNIYNIYEIYIFLYNIYGIYIIYIEYT